MGMGRGPRSRASPSAFCLPRCHCGSQSGAHGRWKLGSTCSRTALGDPGILFIGLGFIQGTGVLWRNFAKGWPWAYPLDSKFLKGTGTPEVTGPFVSHGQEGQAQTKIFFTLNLPAPSVSPTILITPYGPWETLGSLPS